MGTNPLRSTFDWLTARRSRRILTASLVSLLISAVLFGFFGFAQWRGRQALQSDTASSLAQTSRQLLRTLQSRRGTLTLLRDSLAPQTDWPTAPLQALGESAVAHTRHLLGVGMVNATREPSWWSGPQGLSARERGDLNRLTMQRMRLRGAWRVPSTFVATVPRRGPLLVMVEPLRARQAPSRALVGVFDAEPLLQDFFATTLTPRQPVQLLAGHATLLYRSADWQPAHEGRRRVVISQRIVIDATRWTLQMQPANTRVSQTLSWLNLSLIGLGIVAGVGVIALVWILAVRAWILQRAVARRTMALRHALRRLRKLAITDELTGLYNRRFFLERWAWECDRAKRYQRPLACLMIDVDQFKRVNDRIGHPAGDLVLQQVARELKALLRQSDIVARFGGDEFVAALPETTPAQAASVAEKLRRIAIRISPGSSRTLPTVSLSVGVSRLEEPDETPQGVLAAADRALYDEKRRQPPPPRHAR